MDFKFKLWALLMLSLLAAPRVLAEASSSERETARSLMVEGDRLREAGDHAGALERYRSAHALMHVPTTGLALAQEHAQLGQLVEARSVAMDVVNLAASENDPPAFTAARNKASALAHALEPRVATLTTRVEPASADYSLQIDDVVLPQAARNVPFKMNPGAHRVRVQAAGYQPALQRVQLGEGQTEQVVFSLTRAPRVQVEPQPSATNPFSRMSEPESDPKPESEHSDPASAGRVRGILGLSIGGAALVAGITTGALSWAATHDEKSHCAADGACDSSRAAALSRANTLANVANIAIPVGVLGIAYGLYELLTLPDEPPARAQARVQFTLTPSGVLVRGAL